MPTASVRTYLPLLGHISFGPVHNSRGPKNPILLDYIIMLGSLGT